ncbi:helix-turn-helix domain-containing protein [Rhizobium sp. NPDC090275]|uniref:helix-turn-helix domain-containing protein n=1 Tax=Rhizobium sp. NPDC090275 TaxID=3364498 RepID=UPI00383B06E9
MKEWRLTQELTLAEMAAALSIENARTYQRYEDGENRPDAPIVERIIALTTGVVTLDDLHLQRLDWLRNKRPDAFSHPITHHQVCAEGTR